MTHPNRGQYEEQDYDDDAFDPGDEPGEGGRSLLYLVLGVVVLLAITGVMWVAYTEGVRTQAEGLPPPVLTADPAPFKTTPTETVTQPEPARTAALPEEPIIAPAVPATPPAEPAPLPSGPEVLRAPEPAPAAAPQVTATTPAAAETRPETAAAGTAGEGVTEDVTAPLSTAPDPAPLLPVAPDTAPAPAAETPATVATAPAAPVTPAAVRGGAFVVQVGSYPSDELAAAAWSTIRGAHTDLLGTYGPDIKGVEIAGKGTWYRLRVGPFEQRADAQSLCSSLKSRGQDCLVGTP